MSPEKELTENERDNIIQPYLVAFLKHVENAAIGYSSFQLFHFFIGSISLGELSYHLTRQYILRSAIQGTHFAKDVPSTVTIWLYFYICFSAPTFLGLFLVHLLPSQNTRETYEFLIEKHAYPDDRFWKMYKVAEKSPLWELEYAFWKENLHMTPLPSRDGLRTKMKIGDRKERRLNAVEYWRLEKQPGYAETQTPEAIKRVKSMWNGVAAMLGLNYQVI